jgi:DNA-binding beta-propeller fold protein YncE
METNVNLPIYKFLLLFCLIPIFISCEKNNDANEPTLVSVYPNEAGYGDTVLIIGKNNLFSPDLKPVITINDRKLEVIIVGKDTLKIVIPKMLGSGEVSADIGGRQYKGIQFSYKYKTTVTTIAGNGQAGKEDGEGLSSSFNCPWGIIMNNKGDLYVADSYNRLIRKISASGHTVSSLKIPFDLGGKAFYSPYNLALDINQQDLYVTDFNTNILKITAENRYNVIYTGTMPTTGIVMGRDSFLYVTNNIKGTVMKLSTDGKDTVNFASGLTTPRNLFLDKNNNMYVSAFNQKNAATGIFKIEGSGKITEWSTGKGIGGWDATVDTLGNFYIADHTHNCIKIIEKNGRVVTIAGSGEARDIDGANVSAAFNGPTGITISPDGSLYVTTFNFENNTGNKVRKVAIE